MHGSFLLDAQDLQQAERSDAAAERVPISIIVLNWNGWADTIPCVESLFDLDHPLVRIIVCDNASQDDSVARLRGWAAERLPALNARREEKGRAAFRFGEVEGDPKQAFPFGAGADKGYDEILLIHTGANRGYAAGNNAGLRYAMTHGASDYFWILNNDTVVKSDALTWLLRRMQEDPAIGLCGSTLCYMEQPDRVQSFGGSRWSRWVGRLHPIGIGAQLSDPIDRDAVERELRYINGASTLVSRSFVEKVGLMEEDYFLYGEEFDWAARGRKQFRLGFAPKSIVYHKVGASIGTDDFGERSALSDYFLYRNRVRLAFRFMKLSLPIVLADITRDVLRWYFAGRPDRAWLIVRAALGMPR